MIGGRDGSLRSTTTHKEDDDEEGLHARQTIGSRADKPGPGRPRHASATLLGGHVERRAEGLAVRSLYLGKRFFADCGLIATLGGQRACYAFAMRSMVLLVALSLTASAETPRPPACGAPCKEAEKFLGGPQWDYRKSAAIYKRECKADYTGPAEACRLYALAGFKTEGLTLDQKEAVKILNVACRGGDAPACAWKIWIENGLEGAPAKFASLEAPCRAGDRASCEPLFLSIWSVVKKKCDPGWWKLGESTCKAGVPEGCLLVARLLDAERSCDRKHASTTDEQSYQTLAKLCAGGYMDACVELRPNDQIQWEKRCKAGEKFACDAFRK